MPASPYLNEDVYWADPGMTPIGQQIPAFAAKIVNVEASGKVDLIVWNKDGTTRFQNDAQKSASPAHGRWWSIPQ